MGSQRVGHDWATELNWTDTILPSLIAQLVKNLHEIQETWVQSPGEDHYLLRRSPGEGKGYPLQYSGLENSMDSVVHGVTKSQTGLSDFHFHTNLPSACTTLHFHEVYKGAYVSACSLALGIFFCIFDNSHPNRYEVVTHCGFGCVSLMISDVEHVFTHLFIIYLFCFESCSSPWLILYSGYTHM